MSTKNITVKPGNKEDASYGGYCFKLKPVQFVLTMGVKSEIAFGPGIASSQFGRAIIRDEHGALHVYNLSNWYFTAGIRADTGVDYNLYWGYSIEEFKNESTLTGSIDAGFIGFGAGSSTGNDKKMIFNFSAGLGAGGSLNLPGTGKTKLEYNQKATEYIRSVKIVIEKDITKKQITSIYEQIKSL